MARTEKTIEIFSDDLPQNITVNFAVCVCKPVSDAGSAFGVKTILSGDIGVDSPRFFRNAENPVDYAFGYKVILCRSWTDKAFSRKTQFAHLPLRLCHNVKDFLYAPEVTPLCVHTPVPYPVRLLLEVLCS